MNRLPLLSDPRIRIVIQDRNIDCAGFDELLERFGILLLDLRFPDREGVVLRQVVKDLGQPESHDRYGTAVWDIKFDASVDEKTAARSLTTREFAMHTDASFEPVTPRYVAMYVVNQDALGGGVSQIIDSRALLPQLSPASKQTFKTSLFKIRVPDEFVRARHFIEAPLLDNRGNVRFRSELIIKEDCTDKQLAAIAELESLLAETAFTESIYLTTGMILILDNRRFFHARTEIKDKSRHLLRMRFNPRSELKLKRPLAA